MRRSLTPKQRRAMYEAQGGRCDECKQKTPLKGMIGQHTHQVANGNEGKPDRLLCGHCNHVITYGTKATTKGSDIHAIARAKRLAKGGKTVRRPMPKTGAKLRSRPFDSRYRRKLDGTTVRKK